jgi:hypothetical protein
MQKERKVVREKVSQTQVEISKTNLKAAKEQKSARLYELYNSLEKARRDKFLEKMEQQLYGSDDEVDE